jgi:homoserine kinase
LSGLISHRVSLRLPATSANLGPGFDTLALALDLHLEIEASVAEQTSIAAFGRNIAVCGQLEGNLLLDTYWETWQRWAPSAEGPPVPLALTVRNGIPLGMGCGSSAASRLAGIALANRFARLGWGADRMLDEAAALEHHPDNAAACCLGGFVASGYARAQVDRSDDHSHSNGLDHLNGWDHSDRSVHLPSSENMPAGKSAPSDSSGETGSRAAPRRVNALSIAPPQGWHALLVLPELPLATTASRAVLPHEYARATIVENLQNVAVLVAAFASGRGDLLAAATGDRLHQPFRSEVCPLLPRLLALAGTEGVLSVTLSGAGSGVLVLLETAENVPAVRQRIEHLASEAPAIAIDELLSCALGCEPAELGLHLPLQ